MMKIKDIKKICRLENGAVDCEVLFFGMEEYLPYTASPEDMDETGQRIWKELQSGKWGEISPFTVTPELIAAAKQNIPVLEEVSLFDIYQGNQVEKGKKSVSLSFRFRSESKTLTDDEIEKHMKKILGALQHGFDAKLR